MSWRTVDKLVVRVLVVLLVGATLLLDARIAAVQRECAAAGVVVKPLGW